MSFCIVPPILLKSAPCFLAKATYIASSVEAVELMVMLVVTSCNWMPLNRVSISDSESMATPTFPTSPSLIAWSES